MFNNLKNWFLYKLIGVLDNHYESVKKDHVVSWWNPIFCEPTVQLALRDVCRPGDTVFDVGANHGHLSVVMSRLVGPKGEVCSFEASPRNLGALQMNLNRNGCSNCRVVPAAVGETSGGLVGFHYGSHSAADRLGQCDDGVAFDAMVQQLTLDDFVGRFGLEPKVVKMDIEGAEYAALKGFRGSLERLRPIVILETGPDSREGVKLLRSLNYRVIDLCDYRELRSETDFPYEDVVSNVLCIPEETVDRGYRGPIQVSPVQVLKDSDVEKPGTWTMLGPVTLPAGRYAFEALFDGEGTSNNFACGVYENNKVVVRYNGTTSWIRKSYRRWTWHCHRESQIRFFFEFRDGTSDPSFKLHGVRISRVDNFDQDWITTI